MEDKKTARSERHSQHGKEPVCEQLSFAAKEAFKRLRTNLVMSFPQEDTSCHTIGVTSAQPSDGKSTISINLAFSLAELGKRTLLLDADMRRSTIHEKANIEKLPGLSNLLTGTCNSIGEAIKVYRSSNSDTAFDIIPGGDIPKNPSELLNSERMASLLHALAKNYDYIVIDLPPIGAVVDAASVSQSVDGMLVVIRENTCPRGLLAECLQQLSYGGANVIGFVVNGAMEGSGRRYQYGKYGGYGGYGSYYS